MDTTSSFLAAHYVECGWNGINFSFEHLFFHNIGFNWNINLGVVLLYVVLWIIIPEAKTVKQKLEMMGEDDYIQSIRDKVTDNVASAKSRTDTGRYDANTGFASSGLKIDNDQNPLRRICHPNLPVLIQGPHNIHNRIDRDV